MREESITPVTFSREEIAEIRVMLKTADKPASCPRCTEKLKIDGPIGGGPLDDCFYVKCQACRRTGFITKTPPDERISAPLPRW
jgi:hypothetical protein